MCVCVTKGFSLCDGKSHKMELVIIKYLKQNFKMYVDILVDKINVVEFYRFH